MKKATPPIDPGASDEDSELFSRSTDECGGLSPNCLSVKSASGTASVGGGFKIVVFVN